MRNVLICLQVRLKHKTHTHCVTSCLRHVNRCSNCASQFKFVSFNWHNLDQRHLLDELLWSLVIKAVLVCVPSGTLNKHTLNVCSLLNSLCYILRISLLQHDSIQSRFIQSPSLASASGLHQSSKVGLRYV